MGEPMRIHNTLSRRLEVFEPAEPGHVRMYVCGMTVYDYCHVGHARAMVAFDFVHRWLRERGWKVTFVRNHTDVDDKIIRRANEEGVDPLALSARFIAALEEDLDRLGVLRPTVEPKVSEHVDDIVRLVGRLVERGHAYVVDGDVFFSVESFPRYGALSGKDPDDLRAGERVEVDERKRHPADFVLWKSARPGEPAWDSPWGPGRPGWHIECSAMSMRYLGETFDIHGGGIDLVFPHHENEIAQSECATGKSPFARFWMHNGHVTMGVDKMSKSLGNVVRIRDLLDEVPPEALRLLYAQVHYRRPLPYSAEALAEATASLDRLYGAMEVLEALEARGPAAPAEQLVRELGGEAGEVWELARAFPERFAAAMDEDFNTARAVGHLFELVRAVNRLGNRKKWLKRCGALAPPVREAFSLAARVLGVGALEPEEWFAQVRERRLRALGISEEEVQRLVDERTEARAARDWARADALRDRLVELGVVLMDGPDGTRWRMRPQ